MELNFYQLLGQVSGSEAGQVLREFLRGSVRKMICEVMAAEVSELCGKTHLPSDSAVFRAASTTGRILVEGARAEVNRPRVRQRQADGSSRAVQLESDASANDPQHLEEHVLQALIPGVSTRQMAEVKPNSPGVSRFGVSRLWQQAGSRLVEALRSHDLRKHIWYILILAQHSTE